MAPETAARPKTPPNVWRPGGYLLLCGEFYPPMVWIAPSEKDKNSSALEKRLWDAADQFRANSGLKSQEYSATVLGLIFLRFTEVRFAAQRIRQSTLQNAFTGELQATRVGPHLSYVLR